MKSHGPPPKVPSRDSTVCGSSQWLTRAGRFSIPGESTAFTLVELLVVMAVIVLLIGLSVPVVKALKNSGDVTSGAYDLSDALARARASAIANATYVWVGLYEEDGSRDSTRPAAPGTGRLVLATVYSKDGTCIYDPGVAAAALDPARLGQSFKLLKIDNVHLTAIADGGGTGKLASRPPVGTDLSANRISDQSPADCAYPFTYPLGVSAASAQYTFKKIIQFSPRGEMRINCVQDMKPVVEIGLMRCNGATPDTASKNIVAIQMTGIASNLTIFRP